MASHHLTIAKASFAAACLRPDVNKVSRDDLSTFHALFEAAVFRCSPSNVQRTGAFGKYLVSFSKHITDDSNSRHTQNDVANVTQGRQRLHILYILNDMLHHAMNHTKNNIPRNDFNGALRPYILELFQYAASENKKRVRGRINDLIRVWEDAQYFDKTYLDQVRNTMTNREVGANPSTSNSNQPVPGTDLPYVMPATHGDPSTPYYDLPAANLMPHIMPNSAVPMRPDNIRALYLTAGQADEGLINAVKDFLIDVKRIDNPFASLEDEGIVADMDELGQLSYRNENEEVIGDTYYGWSRAFCEKMKSRGQDTSEQGQRHSRTYDSSRSRSPPKRRKYVSSSERSTSPSRSRRIRSPSYSPDPEVLRFGQDRRYREDQTNATARAAPPAVSTANMAHLSISLPPLGPNGVPIPPPKPASWTGPWPPPPPPYSGVGGTSNVLYPPPPPPF